MEPDETTLTEERLEAIRARVLDGASGQVDRRKVPDNDILDLLHEVWRLRAQWARLRKAIEGLERLGFYGTNAEEAISRQAVLALLDNPNP